MDRILRRTQSTIQIELRNASEQLVNADAAPVTVKVTDSAGTEIAGSPFTVNHPPTQTGIYELVLSPAQTALLDTFEAEWSATIGGAAQKLRTQYEVVGNFICSIADIRAVEDRFADKDKFPTPLVRSKRDAAEDLIEQACGVSFRPRGRRIAVSGSGMGLMVLNDFLPTLLVSGSVDGTALTADQISDAKLHGFGGIEFASGLSWARGVENVQLYYEYGMSSPPEVVSRATARLAAHYLSKPAVADRVDSLSSDLGTLRMNLAGQQGPTGIPEVDSVIALFDRTVPGIG